MAEAVANEWIEQVLAEHRHLRTVEADMQEFLGGPRPRLGGKDAQAWAAELAMRILHLHDELLRHFSFEEDSDIVEDLTIRHPEAGREIQEVLAEHPMMLSEIRRIITDLLRYSEGKNPEDPHLRRRISSLLESLDEHERNETRLIQRLEYRDFGTGD